MNVIEATGIVDCFATLGFDHVSYDALWRLADHYSCAKSRLLIVAAYSSLDDFYLAYLLFGQTDIPTYFVTNFENPFSASCFTGNVRVITCEQGRNNTQHIIDTFRKNQNFVLVMAMFDATNASSHTGFLHIAEALQLPIVVAGFDYFQRSCIVSEKRWAPPKGENSLTTFRMQQEQKMYDQLRCICPQTMSKHSFFNINDYKKNNPNFDETELVQLDRTQLQCAVTGNCVSTKEIVVIVSVSVLVIVLALLVYNFVWNKDKKKEK